MGHLKASTQSRRRQLEASLTDGKESHSKVGHFPSLKALTGKVPTSVMAGNHHNGAVDTHALKLLVEAATFKTTAALAKPSGPTVTPMAKNLVPQPLFQETLKALHHHKKSSRLQKSDSFGAVVSDETDVDFAILPLASDVSTRDCTPVNSPCSSPCSSPRFGPALELPMQISPRPLKGILKPAPKRSFLPTFRKQHPTPTEKVPKKKHVTFAVADCDDFDAAESSVEFPPVRVERFVFEPVELHVEDFPWVQAAAVATGKAKHPNAHKTGEEDTCSSSDEPTSQTTEAVKTEAAAPKKRDAAHLAKVRKAKRRTATRNADMMSLSIRMV